MLIRTPRGWELPERGIILPSDFIPIAEETNLIIEIGEWVLDKVCEDLRSWQRSVSSPGRVSVNLSLKQLRQANFINRISAILRGHEISPTSLELEITETFIMREAEDAINLLQQLRDMGVGIAIDDFGTGHSSLAYLKRLPVETLKIDQSFIRDLPDDVEDAAISKAIIALANSLGLTVIAEGVAPKIAAPVLRTEPALVNPPGQSFGAGVVTPGHHLTITGGFRGPEPVRNSEGLLHAP